MWKEILVFIQCNVVLIIDIYWSSLVKSHQFQCLESAPPPIKRRQKVLRQNFNKEACLALQILLYSKCASMEFEQQVLIIKSYLTSSPFIIWEGAKNMLRGGYPKSDSLRPKLHPPHPIWNKLLMCPPILRNSIFGKIVYVFRDIYFYIEKSTMWI